MRNYKCSDKLTTAEAKEFDENLDTPTKYGPGANKWARQMWYPRNNVFERERKQKFGKTVFLSKDFMGE